MKPLIVYYSRRGSNLVDGVVRDLKIGNTELLSAAVPHRKFQSSEKR